LEDIKAGHCRVTLQFSEPPARPLDLPGALSIEGKDRQWTALCAGKPDDLHVAAKAMGCEVTEDAPPKLEDIFIARVGVDRAALREGE
ncbi:MAG: hypothetical protein V3R81_03230, partial [Gammaproteobacteria bacterium]